MPTKRNVSAKKTTVKAVKGKTATVKQPTKAAAKSSAKKTIAKTTIKAKPTKTTIKTKSSAKTKPVAVKGTKTTARALKEPAKKVSKSVVTTAEKTSKAIQKTAKKPEVKKTSVVQSITKKSNKRPKDNAASGPADITPYELQRGEEYMSTAMLAHFKELLLQWKRELMEEVDRTVLHMKDEAANFPDPNDRATQEEEFSLELRTRDRERKLIKKIDEALERIKQEDYGYCETCGVDIGSRRLEARPTATMCIDCKTLEEIREKQLAN